MIKKYNVLAIGAGPGGLISSAVIAGLKGKVALVERRKMGGDCLNYGCVPSKAIIASGRLAHQMKYAEKFGLTQSKEPIDLERVLESMRTLRSQIEVHDSVKRYESLGVEVLQGDATFISPEIVEVNGEKFSAKHFIISVGSRATIPPVAGIESVPYYTNESLFDKLKTPIQSLIIIGCGPIGCELGQTFQRLGVNVSMIQRSAQILPKEDLDVVEVIEKNLKTEGIQLLTSHLPKSVRYENDTIKLVVENNGKEKTLQADALLVATGRSPNIEQLGLDKANIKYNKQGIQTDPYLRTSQKHIFAIGDVAGPYQFTHLADYHARKTVENIVRQLVIPSFIPDCLRLKKVSYEALPWTTYTSPEVAKVGHNEQSARQENIDYDSFKVNFSENDRAILERHTEGFIKVLTKKGSDEIIGATLVGEHGGDLLAELVLALQNKIGLSKISSTIHSFPTHAEIIRKVADAYKRTTLTPKSAQFLEKKFKKQLKK